MLLSFIGMIGLLDNIYHCRCKEQYNKHYIFAFPVFDESSLTERKLIFKHTYIVNLIIFLNGHTTTTSNNEFNHLRDLDEEANRAIMIALLKLKTSITTAKLSTNL